MRIMLLAPLALVACATTADSTAASDAELARVLEGRVAGPPQRCLNDSQRTNPQIIGDRTLLYRESGRRIWVNALPDACPGLSSDRIPVFKIYGSQLCKGDSFETIDRSAGFRGGSCRLGDFVPYEKPKS